MIKAISIFYNINLHHSSYGLFLFTLNCHVQPEKDD